MLSDLSGMTGIVIRDHNQVELMSKNEKPDKMKSTAVWDFGVNEIIVSADVTIDTNLCYPQYIQWLTVNTSAFEENSEDDEVYQEEE
jgi:hypothetical protein